MRSAKSINSLSGQQKQQAQQQHERRRPEQGETNSATLSSPTSPICRCRVMYLGSSVPHITKDGLQGIQEPLRELYPDKATLASGNAGIDSWLSVWSNGILIENVDETGREVKRFFKIDALHYCAAVKYVPLALNQQQQQQLNPYTTLPNAGLPKFLPLDSPHARQVDSNPPIFASILRRTTGIKVLECHAFICKREAAANALVRCCFHAYADTMYAKQIGSDINGLANDINNNNNNSSNNQAAQDQGHHSNLPKQHDSNSMRRQNDGQQLMAVSRSKSIAALNDSESKRESWRSSDTNNYGNKSNYDNPHDARYHQQHQNHDNHNPLIRRKSMQEQQYSLNCDMSDNVMDKQQQQFSNDNLRRQQKLSKSMHHLNQDGQLVGVPYNHQPMKEQANDYDGFPSNQSTSASCINIPNGNWPQQQDPRFMPHQQVPQQPQFYNPYAARVPSYPPQSLIDASNNGGTMRSIRSMAANSIASTLLRSKKHAKAMSMAQLNQDKITSFHQPHSNVSTMGGPIVLPPVPPMFLPNIPARTIINGSQTMKAPSRSMIPIVAPQMNFEAMTPKEMKKLLKKSAKYGIDPSKFGENGLPLLPLRPPPMPPQPVCHLPPPAQHSKGTIGSTSMFSDVYGNEMTSDISSIHGPQMRGPPMPEQMLEQPQMKPILVKPNPEFLKSKAGKKWLKQQKEFKKLLPPHLDGLPIIFGPPPVDALEPAIMPNNNIQPPTFIPPHPGVPIMDSSGYYNPHPFYGQNGRASAASTLIRYSPQSQIMHENHSVINGQIHDNDYHQRIIYNNTMMNSTAIMNNHRGDYIQDDSSMIYGNNECGVDAHGRPYVDGGANRHHPKRNHMVEQSVISLGDENDYDDEEEGQEGKRDDYYGSSNQIPEVTSHSRRSKQSDSGSRSRNNEHIINNFQDKGSYNQQAYEQVAQSTDDQSSYSSGIYKRGHLNERAFSYSIRQEHKSSGGNNSDAEYTPRNEQLLDDDQECRINHNNQHNEYYHNSRDSQSIPVNELTARLENQLNMKSFANSRLKSHM